MRDELTLARELHGLQQILIKETLLLACLSDEVLVQYQRQYRQQYELDETQTGGLVA